MRKFKWLAICSLFCLMISCSSQVQAKPQVVASFSIIADLVSEVGGNKIEVISIIPLGGDPHHWEATSREAIKIANADLLFYNGMGLETWIDKLVESAGKSDLRKVVLSEGLTPLPGVSHTLHDHESGDPHLWLDIENVKHYVQVIATELAKIDPSNQDHYRKRAEDYLEKLTEVDSWLIAQISTIPVENRRFVSYHPSFNYLANRYGLEVLGYIVVNPDGEPSARELASLATTLAKQKRKIIFVEPQVGGEKRLAEVLASEVGGEVHILYSDSLSLEIPTYLEMMYYNGETLVEVLK